MYHPDTNFDVAGGRPSTSAASSSSSSSSYLLAAAIKHSNRPFITKQGNPHSRSLAKPGCSVSQRWQLKKKPAAQETLQVLGSSTHWTMYSCLDSRPAGNSVGFDIVGVESFLLKKDKKFLGGEKGAIFNGKSGFERTPLKVQMVDDTVLIEPADSTFFPKRTPQNWKRTQNHRGGACHHDAKKKTNKMARREGKDSGPEAGNGVVKKYSREEIEDVRFVNGGEQQKIWTSVYTGLVRARVVEEYESLACCDSQRNLAGPRFEPKSLGGTPVVIPGLLGSGDVGGRWNHLNAYVH